MSIAQNLLEIHRQIQCVDRTVQLLAVSKFKSVEVILEAIQAGQTAFGENYVQEGVEKIQYFRHFFTHQTENKLEWHFIGELQSNKTRFVAEYFDWCQTVDRFKIAQRLSTQRSVHQLPLNVLIQINISAEASKSGIAPKEMQALAQAIVTLPNLSLRGLMCIPAPSRDHSIQRRDFKAMQKLFYELQQQFPDQNIDTLSMGMSADLQTAIECGSTMVRVGTRIFGER